MTLVVLGLLCASPKAVALDLSALDRSSYQELDAVSLERAVVVRLVQERFAVVAPSAGPDIVITVSRRGRGVVLSAAGVTAQVQLEPRRLREFHLEVAQKAAELARGAAARLPESAPPPEPLPAVATEPPAPPPSPPPPPARAPVPARAWNVLAAGGVLFRAPGTDFRATIAARYAATERLGVHLEVGLSPAPAPALSAYDGTLQLGAGVQLLGGTVRLEVGLSLGAMLHVFNVPQPGAVEPFGSRLDFLARPFLRGALNPIAGLLVWLQLGAGLSSRAREHRLMGMPVYARGALWLDGVIGLGWET